ncbi:hypothetical protein MHU86_23721 [Fragilaria crotonensis]|nr:hypothetical protein MHU86_23721 [Fragilaria crotonensis]
MPQFKRAIHFGESSTRDIPARVDIKDEEKENIWYTGNDLLSMRIDAGFLIREVLDSQDFSNRRSFAAVLERTYDACGKSSVPTSPDIKLLVKWAKACPARRGLERFCSPEVADKVKDRRKYAIQALLEVQRRSADMAPEERAIRLQKASLKLSKVTKTYARVLGIVDAAAAKEDTKRPHIKAFKVAPEDCCLHKKNKPLASLDQVSAICQELEVGA